MRLAVSLAGSPARTCRLGERRRRTERDLHVASPIRERLPDVGSGHRPPEPGAALMRRPLWALLVLPVALRGLPASEAQAAIAFVKNVGTNGSTTTGTTALTAGDLITVTHPSVAARAVSVNEFTGIKLSAALDKTHTGNGSN